MKRLLLLVFLVCSGALATPIPPSFTGINVNSDPTAAGYIWKKHYTDSVRLWDTPCGALNACPKWRNIATADGVYTWTNFDTLVAAAVANNSGIDYTMGLVPSWVNGTGNPTLSVGAQQQKLFDFTTVLMSHLIASKVRVTCWNEFTELTWWAGTDPELVSLCQGWYPIVHAAGALALSASIDMNSTANGLIVPASPYYRWERYLAGCAAGTPCFDQLNIHGYPGLVSQAVADPQVRSAPELLPSMVNNTMAVASANGFGAYSLNVDEGFAGSAAGDSTTVTDTDLFAGSQARYLIFLASLGIVHQDYFSYGTECAIKNACGSSASNVTNNTLGLNKVGVALRNVTGWLIGANFTTPMTRVTTTNSIRTAANATSTIGKLSGPGGCVGGVDTVGTLPVNWSSSNPHSAAGMSLYNVGSGTSGGIAYIDIRLCGTDTTGSVSTTTASVTFDGAITSTPAQAWVIGGYYAMPAGSSANVFQFLTVQEERSAGAGYLAETNYYTLYPVNQPLVNQYSEFRSRTDNASAAKMLPYFGIKYYYDNGTLPVDVTIRIGRPTAETGGNSTQWIGNVTEQNGVLGIIAWDSSGVSSSYTTPAGFDQYRDIYGESHPIVANTVTLTNSPIIIENAVWKGWAP